MSHRRSLVAVVLVLLLATAVVVTGCAPKTTEKKLYVGIVLPTKDEPRWIQDETRFNDALKDTPYKAEILFSQGDPAKEKANVESLISKGIKVLILCPHDASAAAAAADAAAAAGVKVLLCAYDHAKNGIHLLATFSQNSLSHKEGG